MLMVIDNPEDINEMSPDFFRYFIQLVQLFLTFTFQNFLV